MRPNERDKAYLWDIDDACQDILVFVADTSFKDFENDKMKRFAIERQLLVIGEAANHLSEKCRDDNPEIPWKLLVGLRNIIAHDYGEVLSERIYKIAHEQINELKQGILKLLNS